MTIQLTLPSTDGTIARVEDLPTAITPSGFRANISTANSAPATAGNNSQIVFPNVEYDLASEYNSSTGVFTPTHGGVYIFYACYHLSDTVNNSNRVFISILKSGGSEAARLEDSTIVPNATQLVSGTAIVKASTGDSFYVAVTSDRSCNNLGSPAVNIFSAYKIG